MGAGRFRHHVTIEHNVSGAQDASGHPADNWKTFADEVPLEILPERGEEVDHADQTKERTRIKARMRYLSGMRSDMRIQLGSRTFEIAGLTNQEERNRYLMLDLIELRVS